MAAASWPRPMAPGAASAGEGCRERKRRRADGTLAVKLQAAHADERMHACPERAKAERGVDSGRKSEMRRSVRGDEK